MSIEYRRATPDMIRLLVSTRIEVLRAANLLDACVDMSEVAAQSEAYYREALANGSHTGILAFDGDAFVGAGGVSYYRVMPPFHNPTGHCAYIMNMYVRPAYRQRGIATAILDVLVADARRQGVGRIGLEATDMGRPLYEKFGFTDARGEMELP